tara:strand:+ start:90960 stop:91466 length:507 start_codon:yes stop_codon:yes gene_type:complete
VSAPPLPDIFGNYALGDFVEVTSPEAISWWPQTIGWWWLGSILLGYALYRGWRLLQHWYRNRYRREAAGRLQRLAATTEAPELVADVNRLLKITAMAAFSREQVARLSGDEWVHFLNRHCPTAPFSTEHGQLLSEATYTGRSVGAETGQHLLNAGLAWVQQHENPTND